MVVMPSEGGLCVDPPCASHKGLGNDQMGQIQDAYWERRPGSKSKSPCGHTGPQTRTGDRSSHLAEENDRTGPGESRLGLWRSEAARERSAARDDPAPGLDGV